MTEKNTQQNENFGGALIWLLCAIAFFCSVGLLLCYVNERAVGIRYYEDRDEISSVVPGDCASAVHFKFATDLPAAGNRHYALILYDAAFTGNDLTFANMNEGQWEFSMDGNVWRPLILSKGECVLETNVSAGEKILLLRAADDLDVNAAEGRLTFKLKLKEDLGRITLWVLLGILAGGTIFSVAYLTIKTALKKKSQSAQKEN